MGVKDILAHSLTLGPRSSEGCVQEGTSMGPSLRASWHGDGWKGEQSQVQDTEWMGWQPRLVMSRQA